MATPKDAHVASGDQQQSRVREQKNNKKDEKNWTNSFDGGEGRRRDDIDDILHGFHEHRLERGRCECHVFWVEHSSRSSLSYVPEEEDGDDDEAMAFPKRIYEEALGTKNNNNNEDEDEDVLRFCEPVLYSNNSSDDSSSTSSSKRKKLRIAVLLSGGVDSSSTVNSMPHENGNIYDLVSG